MSMAATLSNVFSLDRQRARFSSDRIDVEEPSVDATTSSSSATTTIASDTAVLASPPSPRSGSVIIRRGSHSRNSNNNHSAPTSPRPSPAASRTTIATGSEPPQLRSSSTINTQDLESGNGIGRIASARRTSGTETRRGQPQGNTDNGGDASYDGDSVDEEGGPESSTGGGIASVDTDVFAGFPILSARTTMTLAELEEERELARRRSSVCILLAAFVLFRLWVLAIQEGDVGLLLLCLVGTSWTARWISYNREREEELDLRIANYIENSNNSDGEGGRGGLIDRNELRMLSFQAQLALAIMESQRQMMQNGGYGNPDGDRDTRPGVSDEAKARWTHFKYKPEAGSNESKLGAVAAVPPVSTKGKYGSVSQKDDDLSPGAEDGPHCSICLSEYDDGDDIIKLPCSHLYHDECISSWTSNHTKCPLCNFDLESVAGDSNTAEGTSSSANHSESIV